MMKYIVIVEKNKDGFGAYVSDLPGCVATGETKDEVLRLIRIEFHLEGRVGADNEHVVGQKTI